MDTGPDFSTIMFLVQLVARKLRVELSMKDSFLMGIASKSTRQWFVTATMDFMIVEV